MVGVPDVIVQVYSSNQGVGPEARPIKQVPDIKQAPTGTRYQTETVN